MVVEASARWEDEDDFPFFVSHERIWEPSGWIWDWWTLSNLKSSFACLQLLFEDSELELSALFSARLWWSFLGILKFGRGLASADQAGWLRDSDIADLGGAELTGDAFSIAFEMLFVLEIVPLDKEDVRDVSASLGSLFAHKSFNNRPFSCSNSFSGMDLAVTSSLVFALQFFSFLESFLALPNIFCILCSCSLNSGLFTLDDILWWDLPSQPPPEVACLWEQTLLALNAFEDPFSTVLMPPTGTLSLTK